MAGPKYNFTEGGWEYLKFRYERLRIVIEDKRRKEAARLRRIGAPPGLIEELNARHEKKLEKLSELFHDCEEMHWVDDQTLRIKNSNERVSFSQFRNDGVSVLLAARRRSLTRQAYEAAVSGKRYRDLVECHDRDIGPAHKVPPLVPLAFDPGVKASFYQLSRRGFSDGCGLIFRAPTLDELDRRHARGEAFPKGHGLFDPLPESTAGQEDKNRK